MQLTEFLNNIMLLTLAITPVSLVLIEIIEHTVFKNQKKLGNLDVLCTNISKILIKDYLSVKSIFIDDKHFKTAETTNLKDSEALKLIATITHLGKYKKTQKIDDTIANFTTKFGLNRSYIESEFSKIDEVKNKKKKKFTTVISENKTTREKFAFTKGNPYEIIKICTRTLIDGKKIDLDNQKRRLLKKQIEKMNKKGQKVIAFAYRPMPLKRLEAYESEFIEKELIFIGLTGIAKPINRESGPAIEKIKNLGIKIIVTSSIKEKNAIAISKELGIINPKYFESIPGSYLETLNDSKLQKILNNKEKDYIFCELEKNQKQRILKNLENLGKTSFLMEKKEDNFNNILNKIKKRRQIIKNQNKLIIHSFSCKIPVFALTLLAVILKIPTPLSIGLILVLDLIINLGLEMGLRISSNTKASMETKNHVLSLSVIMSIALISVFMWNISRLGWFYGENYAPYFKINTSTTTILFFLIASFQIITALELIEFKLTKIKNIFIPLFSLITLLILYIISKYQFFNELFHTENINNISAKIILSAIFSFLIIQKLLIPKLKKENGNTTARLS